MLFTVNDIDIPTIFENIGLQARKGGNPGKRNNDFKYRDIVCAFDIETTRYKVGEHEIAKGVKRDDEVSIMYIWQFQIGLNITIYGRYWYEFKSLIQDITDTLNDKERLVIYVHNLSYEFSFLKDKEILGKDIDEKSVFILSSRKVLKFLAFDGKLEFRCSYIHSNMSLDLFTDKMQVEHKKLSGKKFDYNKQRFSWTELTDYEMQYCVNDVIGLVEAIYKEMEIDGDNLYSICLTSTGYVRRDIKSAIRNGVDIKDKEGNIIEHIKGLPKGYIQERKTDYETYKLLREAFRGGNTHANRGVAGKTIPGPIEEYDRSSSYPDTQLNGKFPISRFSKPRKVTRELFENCLAMGYSVIARLQLYNVCVRDEFVTVPYISKSSCKAVIKPREDNGRILEAMRLTISVTEYDLEIIVKQYEFEYRVLDFRIATKGYLPECIKETIRTYYRLKTELKGDELNAILYMKSKNKLNSIYGNSAQDGGKMNIIYKDGKFLDGYIDKKGNYHIFDELTTDEEREDLRKLIYESTNTSLCYQWGVYTTAIARYELQQMIDNCGDNFLYCDTDSVYFVQDGTINFDEYNAEKIKNSTNSHAFADDAKGKRHYMGVAEKENVNITYFKTLGAKKYCYIYLDDKGKPHMNTTVSGVVKKYGSHELLRRFAEQDRTNNPLDLFDESFIFIKAGGNEIVYNDISCFVEIDGIELYVPTNAVIRPSTYEIGLSDDYLKLLDKYGSINFITLIYRDYYDLDIDNDILL